MTPLEYARNRAFWLIDSLRGGSIKKAYRIIENCDKGLWSEDEISSYQKKALEKLLSHTKSTVPAYRNCDSLELTAWPVVTKAILKEDLENHISSDYSKEDLIVMSTSGSTGTPFRSYQNIDKKRHVNAEVLYYNGLVGFKIGKKILYFRSIVSEVAKSKFSQFIQNIRLLDCQSLSDDNITTMLRSICKSNAAGGVILSYASTLDAFRKYFQRYGYSFAKKCKINGIISGSELLQDITRETLEKAFGCKVVSRYANEENGFLGQDFDENNVFIPNRANYFIEILKLDSDEHAEIGEVGRIVVTDLYNYAMPFVRYDTGDVGAWTETTHFGRKVLAIGKFGGRIVDMIFDTSGNQVSPHLITNTMWEFQQIKQFQFIQKDKREYVLKLNITGSRFDKEQLLTSLLTQKLGNDAIITTEYCDEIPKLASGKRRYIVNLMA